jgi:hypothetical protein
VRDARLRPEAFAIASYIGQGVREISGVRARLVIARTYPDGFSFDIRRDYASAAQAEAFQYMLDRLQALNLIAWTRTTRTIHITASSEGGELDQ